jgi:asparagine synthase (glutamine-hydrolysing)
MTGTLAHRGPDSHDTWIDRSAGIALGHRRLAIVDLSPAGHQPMVSASGRYVIVFNGEIYNFFDLRKELESTGINGGICFNGHSDTEIMLACFERWGVVNAVKRFNGMFAFALWDRLERTLHLARDPLGEKPLYYGWQSGTLLFGSELKALRAHPAFTSHIDRGVLGLYFKCGYVPAPYSIYQGIFKLPQGAILSIEAERLSQRTISYWSVKDAVQRAVANPFRGSEQEAVQQLSTLLADATRMRMISDVPLGAFLSGGIDSSLVVALMQASSSQRVKTFTIGFFESQYNEAANAKAVAAYLGTDHTEWYVTPAEAISVVPRLPVLYDEPFADSSQIPTFLVSTLARRHVTVALSGDGGDELFGGYERYSRISRLWRRMGSVPLPLRKLFTTMLKPIGGEGASPPLGSYRFQKALALAPLSDPAAFYDAHLSNWRNPAELVRGPAESLHGTSLRELWPGCDDLRLHMMAADTATYLPDDILVKVDRAAMGISLETRIPLLDTRIVEFAWRLPLNMRIRAGQTKWPLRRLLDKYVPRVLVDRPKSGFAMPVAGWIRGPLRSWAEELLDAKRIDREGYLAAEPIRKRWTEHLSGRHDHSGFLWSVLMFQAWLQAAASDLPTSAQTFVVPAAASPINSLHG